MPGARFRAGETGKKLGGHVAGMCRGGFAGGGAFAALLSAPLCSPRPIAAGHPGGGDAGDVDVGARRLKDSDTVAHANIPTGTPTPRTGPVPLERMQPQSCTKVGVRSGSAALERWCAGSRQ